MNQTPPAVTVERGTNGYLGAEGGEGKWLPDTARRDGGGEGRTNCYQGAERGTNCYQTLPVVTVWGGEKGKSFYQRAAVNQKEKLNTAIQYYGLIATSDTL